MTYGMSLRMLLEGWLRDPPDIAVAGLDLDSRRIEPGHAFIAVQGSQEHGFDHATQAVEKGCVAIIHDGKRAEPDVDVPCVAVPDLNEKLGELASRFWAAPSDLMTIAGVTGTNGKTSVAHFLAQSWQRVYGLSGMIGTLGYGSMGDLRVADRTTPDVLKLNEMLAGCLDSGIDRVSMEVSSHALEQGRCQTVQFDAAIFTNLSRDHLDYHQDMRAYALVKKKLFTEYAPGFAVINHDDPTGRGWIGELGGQTQVLGFGMSPGAELGAEILGIDADGTKPVLPIASPTRSNSTFLNPFNGLRTKTPACSATFCAAGRRSNPSSSHAAQPSSASSANITCTTVTSSSGASSPSRKPHP